MSGTSGRARLVRMIAVACCIALVGCFDEGIANSGGTNTDIEDNKIRKSRTDICNDGTVGTFEGNAFDTGGIATACVVD